MAEIFPPSSFQYVRKKNRENFGWQLREVPFFSMHEQHYSRAPKKPIFYFWKFQNFFFKKERECVYFPGNGSMTTVFTWVIPHTHSYEFPLARQPYTHAFSYSAPFSPVWAMATNNQNDCCLLLFAGNSSLRAYVIMKTFFSNCAEKKRKFLIFFPAKGTCVWAVRSREREKLFQLPIWCWNRHISLTLCEYIAFYLRLLLSYTIAPSSEQFRQVLFLKLNSVFKDSFELNLLLSMIWKYVY